jgi:hypothetical protein
MRERIIPAAAANVNMPSDFPRHHRFTPPDRAEVLIVALVTIAPVLGCGSIAVWLLPGFRHIHPPSTIQRCAVQERESSAASHSKIRATSSGYSLCGRHWLRRIESSASGVTQ